jgi:hypothetical protein
MIEIRADDLNRPITAAARMPEQKVANLALQGGGTHGAFT